MPELTSAGRILPRSTARTKPKLRVLLASPRGFCAGVTRAIEAVERALDKHGAPVYVRRPIVHNLEVVRSLEAKGAIFVEELDEVPDGSVVLFSAHGVAPMVTAEARDRQLTAFDAVCPLVAKVHREVERHQRHGRPVVLIGHHGHPEIEGTLGRIRPGSGFVINSVEEVDQLPLARDTPTAYAVQTTFSVDDAHAIVEALRQTFSNLVGPASSDICYATTNRQAACSVIADEADAVIVVGEHFSSNARRLAEVAAVRCPLVQLVAEPETIDLGMLAGAASVGITAAASTPERSVEAVIGLLREWFDVAVEQMDGEPEARIFKPVEV